MGGYDRKGEILQCIFEGNFLKRVNYGVSNWLLAIYFWLGQVCECENLTASGLP